MSSKILRMIKHFFKDYLNLEKGRNRKYKILMNEINSLVFTLIFTMYIKSFLLNNENKKDQSN